MPLRDYKLGRSIGKGSFGTVYRALKLSDGSDVALKAVDINSMNAKEREAALKEVRILAAVSHTHIIAYKEAFIEDDTLYIVTEFAAGGDLYGLIQKQLQKGRLLHEDIVWRYVIEAVLALKHLHEKRIIHRDLKPQNILLDGKGHLKIADLGLGRTMSEQTLLVHTRVGTPYYLSPELIRGDGYDEMSDVYALGAVLYELCSLKPPFRVRNNNIVTLQNKILTERPAELHEYYSDELKLLIFKMLEKQPQDRPSITHILAYSEVKVRMKELEMKKREKILKMEAGEWKNEAEEWKRKYEELAARMTNQPSVDPEVLAKAAQYTPLIAKNKQLEEASSQLRAEITKLQGEIQRVRAANANPDPRRIAELEEELSMLSMQLGNQQQEFSTTPTDDDTSVNHDIDYSPVNLPGKSVLDGQLALWKTGLGDRYAKQDEELENNFEVTPPTPAKKVRSNPESEPSSSVSYCAVSEGQLPQYSLDYLRVCKSSDARKLPSLVSVFTWMRRAEDGEYWDPDRKIVLLQPSNGITILYKVDPRDSGNIERIQVREEGDRKYKNLPRPIPARLTSVSADFRILSLTLPPNMFSAALTHFVLDFEDNEKVAEVYVFRVYPEIQAFIR
ncbi:hypothetical protein RCL1_001872 [Eukaryota sp. TZLM3-RCL]